MDGWCRCAAWLRGGGGRGGRGEVAGVGRRGGDDAWKQRLEVAVVGFGAAEGGTERAEGVGRGDGRGLLRGEAGSVQEGDPAVVLGAGCDGFVFGRELGDAGVAFLLVPDRFVRGGFGADAGEDPGQDRSGAGVAVGGDVGGVGSRPRVIAT